MLGFRIFPKFGALGRIRGDTYFDATGKGQGGPTPPTFVLEADLASLADSLVSGGFPR